MADITQTRTVVTVQEGRKQRRYLVAREDEHLLDNVVNRPVTEALRRSLLAVDGQWLRARNVVDEMSRCVFLSDAVRITRKPITVRWPY